MILFRESPLMLFQPILRATLFAFLSLACFASLVRAQDSLEFAIQNGDRVVFLGDSNTQAGTYVVYLDAYVRTRFPGMKAELINHGLSSETINGMSEDDHPGKRPWIHDRLERDALAWKPTDISICYGMNDGNYFPMHPERFAKFQSGYDRFFELVEKAKIPQVYVLTPPPFDPYRRKVGDEKAIAYGYKFPAADYDRTLATYSDWLVEQSPVFVDRFTAGITVVDVHSALNSLLTARREGDVNYSFSGDAVHPDATGHLLIAMQVLEAWNRPTLGDLSVQLHASLNEGSLVATLPLPMPRDSRWDEKMVELSGWADRLTTLTVSAPVNDGNWKLTISGKPQESEGEATTLFEGQVSGAALGQGLELDADKWPALQDARAKVLANVQKRQDLVYRAWRKEIDAGGDGKSSIELPELAAIDEELARDARPWDVRVVIERMP